MTETHSIARVFPSKTSYSPDDEHVFFGPPSFWDTGYDEVHVSCVFTWDKKKAERLAMEWAAVCDNVKIGGPAYGSRGGEFVPGRYIRKGYTITSRGCCRKCEFCFVPKREGTIREVPINVGHLVLDNNLLACSRKHVKSVFEMLNTQRDIRFLGGLDARLLKDWHIDLLVGLGKRLRYFYIAYDQPNQKEPVRKAIEKFYSAGLVRLHIGCYVLVGYKGDTVDAAERRCEWVFVQGGLPFAMYFRPIHEESPVKPKEWAVMSARWMWHASMYKHIKKDGLQYHKTILRGDLAGTNGRKSK